MNFSGTMTWPDGFKMEGNWMFGILQNSNFQLEIYVAEREHPVVQECVEKLICTRTLDDPKVIVPEWAFKCQTCDEKVCCSCASLRCHPHNNLRSLWDLDNTEKCKCNRDICGTKGKKRKTEEL